MFISHPFKKTNRVSSWLHSVLLLLLCSYLFFCLWTRVIEKMKVWIWRVMQMSNFWSIYLLPKLLNCILFSSKELKIKVTFILFFFVLRACFIVFHHWSIFSFFFFFLVLMVFPPLWFWCSLLESHVEESISGFFFIIYFFKKDWIYVGIID